MHRFYGEKAGGEYRLQPEEARHALRVLRLASGDEIELLADGERRQAVLEVREDGVYALPGARLPDTEARLRVTLYQGLPKADKMDWIVQKATELGAAEIRPVQMVRSVSRAQGRDAARKAERWQAIAREAVKQCGRVRVPDVKEPQPFPAMEEALKAHDVLLVPWESAGRGASVFSLVSGGEKKPSSVGVVIGPEGGMEEEEVEWLRDRCGAVPVSLGPRILRTETAALAALALILGAAGEME